MQIIRVIRDKSVRDKEGNEELKEKSVEWNPHREWNRTEIKASLMWWITKG